MLSQRIVEHRDAYGPFTSVDALLEVSGVGASKLSKYGERFMQAIADFEE